MPSIARRAFCNILGASRYRRCSDTGTLFGLEGSPDHTARERVFLVVPWRAVSLVYDHLAINI